MPFTGLYRFSAAVLVYVLVFFLAPIPTGWTQDFIRGDVNSDQRVSISDLVFMAHFLFLDGPSPLCLDSADVDDDGDVSITDAIGLLSFTMIFGSPLLPPPYPMRCVATM